MATTAVFQNGGKQYLVKEGDVVLLEKVVADEGKSLTFEEVLMAATDKTMNIGTPFLSGAKVEGKILEHGRHEKVFGVKVKPKKRQKKYFGHKQWYTKVEITKIATK
ncbi:MAG: 50S ribosomal protein L21 [Candidatus Andersenbacteria bacterium]|nr:50S ribosomal protein L21 [Candidatus Andersenbacteria bacterium]MBI3250444.1 50S ribosomal protein L21 [Candidatus Andersenbacteria bacterium]